MTARSAVIVLSRRLVHESTAAEVRPRTVPGSVMMRQSRPAGQETGRRQVVGDHDQRAICRHHAAHRRRSASPSPRSPRRPPAARAITRRRSRSCPRAVRRGEPRAPARTASCGSSSAPPRTRRRTPRRSRTSRSRRTVSVVTPSRSLIWVTLPAGRSARRSELRDGSLPLGRVHGAPASNHGPLPARTTLKPQTRASHRDCHSGTRPPLQEPLDFGHTPRNTGCSAQSHSECTDARLRHRPRRRVHDPQPPRNARLARRRHRARASRSRCPAVPVSATWATSPE